MFLSEEHLMLQDMYRKFAEKEFKPIAREVDETEHIPDESIQKLGQFGYLGIPIPEEYGGQGGDFLSYVLAMEEIAKVCASTSNVVSAHTSLCTMTIFNNGTEEQKRKYVVPLAQGEKVGSFGLTEPNAGTDASGIMTTAVLKGDHYVLNGTKIFITNAAYSKVFLILAMTDKSQGTKGISAFIVERDFPGFTVGHEEKKMGIRGSSTCELIMDNCIVPKENLLGAEGDGFKIAMKSLDSGRIAIGAQALGIAEGAFNECMTYIKQRMQFGKRISQFQNTQFEVADMYKDIEAAKLLVYRAAHAKDAGEPYGHYAAMAKLAASECASDVTRRCLQLMGGYGYMRDYPVERMMRDAKITEIYEGTSEVQKMILASYLKVN